jgi:hypothetical protein
MKYAAMLLLPLLTLGAIYAAEPANPHEGIKIRTPWNHKNTQRYQPPPEIIEALKKMEYTWATDGNLDRPVMPRFFPALINARKHHLAESWEIVEYAQIERQPLGGGKVRYNWVDNGRDFPQSRIFLPPEFDAAGKQIRGGTYTIWRDLDIDPRNRLHVINTPGHWNGIVFSKALEVHPLGRIDLGEGFSVGRPRVGRPRELTISPEYIVEKDGEKYVRVNGGKLLLKLEAND